MFVNKDNLCKFFLAGHVHVSKKDYGFFNNINNSLQTRNTITSNQAKLFDKLILKYQRQLTRLGYAAKNLQDLSWEGIVVQSKDEFLDAYISIVDDQICIRSPFKTAFVQQIRKNNHFEWDKVERLYKAKFSTHVLKFAVSLASKHYERVNYCPELSQMLAKLAVYDSCKYWKPTLVKRNNSFYIYCINENLYKAIEKIELNGDVKTLFELSQYGIFIDESVTEGDKLLELAGTFDATIDLDYFDSLCRILNLLEVDRVFTSRDIVYNKEVSNEIKLMLLQHGISCNTVSSTSHEKGILIRNGNSTDYYNSRIQKVITLTNSRPIKIR